MGKGFYDMNWLFKKFGVPFFLFEGEGAGGGGAGAGKTFTQDDVNKIAGDARAEGRTASENELLKKYGVKNLDELATLVTAARDADAKNKTDLEKLQADLTKAQGDLGEAKSQAEKNEAALKARILNS